MSLHYFELPKLPPSVSKNNRLQLWLSLFKAETEEELVNLEALEVPEMKQAISAYKSITVTPEFREMERLRSKARHDEAQALYNAERKAETAKAFSIAKNLLGIGLPLDKITETTGLTRAEIEELQITQ
jgi:predicted transposase/invertase (TIGR01784 family)